MNIRKLNRTKYDLNMIYRGDDMKNRDDDVKYIILLKVGDVIKPMEEATPEERKALDEKVKKSFEKRIGLKYIGRKAI